MIEKDSFKISAPYTVSDERLMSVLKNAKAKKTKVAARIVLEDGSVFYGCNLESACHTLSICAERAAVINALIHQGPEFRIKDVWVIAEKNGTLHNIKVCGSCLQLLSEFAAPDLHIQGYGLDVLYPIRYS
ncbi:cytidine deaminase [Holospora obtusa F1]|uniref:Cytidine deaminase n=1 Tax=Holospora obtusa F1 TaxID=1399147 RepID=W6TED5_HOLOB|nr:cytidine deaminase [Holospora obtusa]ETZ07064.1 cytidine deaminase [Holospora obtusa F1]